MGYQENFPPPTPNKNNLTWLWVVLGVGGGCGLLLIVVIAAVLFPVFSQARGKAKGGACMSNLRILGTAMSMYVQDYDEKYPAADDWTEATSAYYKNPYIAKCPTVSTTDNGLYGYAYNDTISGLSLGKLKNPATGTLIYDSSNLQKDAHDPFTSLPVPGRHNGGNNVVFQDGHTKFTHPSGSAAGK